MQTSQSSGTVVPEGPREWIRSLVLALGQRAVYPVLGISRETQLRILASLPVRASSAKLVTLLHERALAGDVDPRLVLPGKEAT